MTKDQGRKDGGKGPRDPDAKWGAKARKRPKINRADIHHVKYFYRYKGHMSMNVENNLITSLEATSGEA